MPVAADWIFNDCANPPILGTETNIGGAEDATAIVSFTQLASDTIVEIVSSNAGDTTQTATLYYVDASGTLKSEAKSLNGTTVVDFTDTIHKLRYLTLSASAAGTVTLRIDAAGGDLMILPAGVVRCRILHTAAASIEAGAEDYYDCYFINNSSAGTANSVTISETTDAGTLCAFDIAATADTSTTNGVSNDHTVAFTVPSSYASTDKTFGNLLTGESIQVFTKLTLAQSAAAGDQTLQHTVQWTNA